jgi:4-alpha-glucanotransferase
VRDRRAGILLPLFSLRTARSWGVGDLGDLRAFCPWLAAAGHTVLQLLRIAETAAHETSPYGALSAFALDPLYLDLEQVEDFAAVGGLEALSRRARDDLDAARAAPTIAYAQIRRVKREALLAAFARFEAVESATGSTRAAAFAEFVASAAWWLDDYVVFRALGDAHQHQPWTSWTSVADDAPSPTVVRARRYYAWVQWLLAQQWTAARRAAADAGVHLYGDMPFMVSEQSADVWARRREFQLDATIGAPPDAFSAEGQDWGLPVMRWDLMAERDYAWWRARCRRAAELFEGVRLDHVIGYYRVYARPSGGTPFFRPEDEPSQVLRAAGVAR